MADHISPGVYSRIIDLNSYLTSTSGTIGFLPIITEKGQDNVLTRVTSYQEYIDKFGEPDIRTFGKYYGCGPYVATQHLSVSSDLYVLRALPDDATYSHTFIYFSQVDDFPYAYKFADRHADVIMDDGKIVSTNLYLVADGSVEGQPQTTPTWAARAIAAGVAYDSELQNTDIEEDVMYVSAKEDEIDPVTGKETPHYAKVTTCTKLYSIDFGTTAVDKRAAAIAAGKAYGADFKLIATTETEVSKALYTSDTSFAQAGAIASFYAEDENLTFTVAKVRVAEWEPTSSSGDFDVGYKKYSGALRNRNGAKWYNGKHTSLSAVSIIPGMIYGVQSDVTCYAQTIANVAGYKIAAQYKHTAFLRRVGYDEKGFIVLDDETKIVSTTRREFAFIDPSTSLPVAVRVQQPVYVVDPEPWYELDQTLSNKNEAIANYDAFDQNGFLTNDASQAIYCGMAQYAKKDSSGEPIVERRVALRKPETSKFVVDGENMLYVMDTKIGTFLNNAKDAIAKCCAWDKNGYPALTPADVVITSIADYAVTAKAPKMNNTQKLDSLFIGNDTLILGAIRNIEGNSIYSKNKRLAHNCMLGYVRAVGRGSYYNSYSIKITSDANPAAFGTYKFQVFELQDGAEVMCESYNISFDPTALDADGETMYWVDVINKYSDRVVVEGNENSLDLFTQEIAEFYHNDPTITDVATDQTFVNKVVIEGKTVDLVLPLVGGFPTVVPEFITDETSSFYDKIVNADINDFIPADYAGTTPYFGYKAEMIWEGYYAKAWAQKATFDAQKQYEAALELDDSDSTKSAKIGLAIDAMNAAQEMTADAEEIISWASAQNLMNMNDSDGIAAGEQPFYLENGSLGSLINDKGVVNSQVGNQILCFAYTGLLKNPVVVKNVDESTGMIKYKQQYTDNVYDLDWIYFTLVYDPGYKPDVKQAALELVDTYRRDCVLISDCGDNADYEDCLKYVGAVLGAADARIWNTYLAARYEPYSRVYDKFTAKDIWVSPVYHMAKLIPQTDKLYNLWYAAAGFNRGTCSDIKELRYSANKAQRDLLYLAQVNPIVHFPEGMTVWGQLTTQKKNSTLSDLHAVRTVLYIKRAIEQYCKNYVFEHNNATTWANIQGGIQPMLDTIVANGGLESYSVEVGATDYELKIKTCHVNVTLQCARVLEKIELNLYVK